jgi:hypothetical protein
MSKNFYIINIRIISLMFLMTCSENDEKFKLPEDNAGPDNFDAIIGNLIIPDGSAATLYQPLITWMAIPSQIQQ